MTSIQKNPTLKKLIIDLEKTAKKQKVNIWARIAQDLASPTRQHTVVNVKKISQLTKENDSVIVAGKVLATGTISHKVTVVAYQCSASAADKIKNAGGVVKTIAQELTKNPKGSNLRIVG